MDSGTFRGGETLVIFLVGFVPLGLQLWFVLHRASKRGATHEAMLAEAGVSPSSGFDYSERGTGIAINPKARTLTLLDGGFWKTYAFDEVREWETRHEQASQMIGGGLMGVAAAAGNDRRAAANTGLFVVVKDIENPKWRIEMRDVRTQARWMEILRQQLNER